MEMREGKKVVCPAKACTDIKYGSEVVENSYRYSESKLLTMYFSSLAQHNSYILSWVQFSSVQLLSCVRLFATPWIAARQASLSITNSRSSLKLTSIKSVMSSSHLILCHPLLLLPPVPPSIRVFSNESALMRWPKYWSFSFSIIPSKENFKGLSSELVLHTRKAIGLFYVLVLFSGYGIFAFHFYLLD